MEDGAGLGLQGVKEKQRHTVIAGLHRLVTAAQSSLLANTERGIATTHGAAHAFQCYFESSPSGKGVQGFFNQ